MICQNCGENEANVKYTHIVNGVKKEMLLCEECSNKLGIGNMDFSMPINFSSFLGDFFDEEKEFVPNFIKEELQCKSCGMTYDNFISSGKFGCDNCYDVFSQKIDAVLKNIHGGNRHVGRIPSGGFVQNNKECNTQAVPSKQTEIEVLKRDLKLAIKEERYEDAARLRDEIKKIENSGD